MILFDVKAISLHSDLPVCSQSFFKRMKRSLLNSGINLLSYAKYDSPFVLRSNKGQPPQLLSHHFVYLLVKNAGEPSFYAREVTTIEQVSEVLAADKLHFRLIENALMGKKPYSSQTQSHQKRRSAQQLCPLCPGPLTGQKGKKGKIKDGKEYFEVKCHYRHYPRYNCDFFVELEKTEYILFKKNRYPTNKWLNKLDAKRCPRCKDLLFEMKLPDGRIYHQCRNTLIRQFPGEDYCDFRTEITDEKLER